MRGKIIHIANEVDELTDAAYHEGYHDAVASWVQDDQTIQDHTKAATECRTRRRAAVAALLKAIFMFWERDA